MAPLHRHPLQFPRDVRNFSVGDPRSQFKYVVGRLQRFRWPLAVAFVERLWQQGLQYSPPGDALPDVGASLVRSFRLGLQWQDAMLLASGRCLRIAVADAATWAETTGNVGAGLEWKQALSGLSAMKCRGLELNGAIFGTAFASLAQDGRSWSGSLQLLRRIRRASLQPSYMDYAKVLSSCARSAWSETLYFLQLAKQEDIILNDIAAAAALNAAFCRQFRPWQWACCALSAIRRWQIPISSCTYNSAVGVFSKRPKLWREVLEIETQVAKAEFYPDAGARQAFRVARIRRRAEAQAAAHEERQRRGALWQEALASCTPERLKSCKSPLRTLQ
ncbi:unnamed protein product, partial [Symbiodinium sp. CCMP2456]